MRTSRFAFVTAAAMVMAMASPARAWTVLYEYPGCATSVTSIDGVPWITGCSVQSSGGEGLYTWDWPTVQWRQLAGQGVQIASNAAHDPWLINAHGTIYEYTTQGTWSQLGAGCGTSLAINSNGYEYVTGCTLETSYGYGIFNNVSNFPNFSQMGGQAVQVAIGLDGVPWVVDSHGNIYSWNGSGWSFVSPPANTSGAQSIGGDWANQNSVWVIATDRNSYRWDGYTTSWSEGPGSQLNVQGSGGPGRIASDPDGDLFLIDNTGYLWQFGQ